MFKPLRRAIKLIIICSAVLTVTACVQTGYSYSTAQFSSIKVGESTLDDVNRILGAHPTNVYRALDGSFTAMYSHKSSVLADAIYFNKELLLAFDNHGKFKHVIGGDNQVPPKEDNINNKSSSDSNNDTVNTLQPQTVAVIEQETEVIVIEKDDQPTTTITETITEEAYTKCPSDCSSSAPNTYPVYLKRSGNNVIKRYDFKK